MTYKNIKFEDSPVMRSLERLAVKKGLVNPEVTVKTATAALPPLKPTENLEENILILSSALRNAGFTKQASEIETKFFNLKKAEHLYDTHGETGPDVINRAHPEGSHHMQNVDGDALVETILDKQKAIQQMISKVPTGKLANKKLADFVKNAGQVTKDDAVNAVKVILGQTTPVVPELNFPAAAAPAAASSAARAGAGAGIAGTLNAPVTGFMGTLAGASLAIVTSAIIGGVIGWNLFSNKFYAQDIKDAGNNLISDLNDVEQDLHGQEAEYSSEFRDSFQKIMELIPQAMTMAKGATQENVEAVIHLDQQLGRSMKACNNLMGMSRSKIDKGWTPEVFSGYRDVELQASNFSNVIAKINTEVTKMMNQIKTLVAQHAEQSTPAMSKEADHLLQSYNSTLSVITSYKALIHSKRLNNESSLMGWLDQINEFVKGESEDFSKDVKGAAPNDQNIVVNNYSARLQEIQTRLNAFKTKWVG